MEKSKRLMERLEGCPVEAFLKLIGQRWNAYILIVLLQHGETRFGVLKKLIPQITPKVLTDKLRELESSGLVKRDYQPTIPPKVSYKLSTRGKELEPLLMMTREMAMAWRKKGII